MDELHEREQYFFDDGTLDHLATFVGQYENPCCLCTPLLGQRLVERGSSVRILDVDERFASLTGYRHFDVYRPEWIEEEFDLTAKCVFIGLSPKGAALCRQAGRNTNGCASRMGDRLARIERSGVA